MPRTEATISWDVSGYYMYLPSQFIYNDIKKCEFYPELRNKYNFTPDFQQAFIHPSSGNYVMKYSMGQAIHFTPFFFIAHLYALNSSIYDADGFSPPYQFMISLGSLVIAFIGVFFMLKALNQFYDKSTSFISILIVLLGSNYLNYVAIDGAMTHNTLFTLYAILIYSTIKFYEKPTYQRSLIIGLCVGMAALTRPTEILSCLIPLLWALNPFNINAILDRFKFFKKHSSMIILAILICATIGSLQLLYWRTVSGEWLIYSYQNEGFSWLRPHILDGLFSYKSGWLIYSPLMIFSLIGFLSLYKLKRSLFYVTSIFTFLFIYIAFSWNTWWYGGSLGQRTMVQAYPILLFPFAAFLDQLKSFPKFLKVIVASIMCICVYLSLWFTHQAHKGGLLHAGMMTKAYFWKTLGTYERNNEDLKLLDTDEYFIGQREAVIRVIDTYPDPFTLHLNGQYSERFNYKLKEYRDWIRVAANFSIGQKEWDTWRMTQMVVSLKNHNDIVKQKFIRIQRHLNDGQSKRLFIDVRIPDQSITDIDIYFWNAEGNKSITIDNATLELFNER